MGAGEKAGPPENWVADVWEFQRLHGAIARWVSGLTGVCGDLFGRVCPPNELLNYWAPLEKRLGARTGLLTSGNFSYTGPSPTGFRALLEGCGDLLGWVCQNELSN